MNSIRILLADDDLIFVKLTASLLENHGYSVLTATNVNACTRALKNEHFDIMMLDMCYPALQDGFGMLEDVHENYPDLPVLMISGSGHIPDAVSAIKNGATDFIEKPLDSNHLLIRLERLSDSIKMVKEVHDLQIAAIGMKGTSPAMVTMFSEIVKAAKFDCPVLITG
ncbi:MAG: response regulator, partial [Candidatus Cloacimonetes bacterium]|nr:response regulator [Candidatus Cloacimonadota bacterium]